MNQKKIKLNQLAALLISAFVYYLHVDKFPFNSITVESRKVIHQDIHGDGKAGQDTFRNNSLTD